MKSDPAIYLKLATLFFNFLLTWNFTIMKCADHIDILHIRYILSRLLISQRLHLTYSADISYAFFRYYYIQIRKITVSNNTNIKITCGYLINMKVYTVLTTKTKL